MPPTPGPSRCSTCGRTGPREAMYGAEPDLLCEACSERVRRRLAPRPVGRTADVLDPRRSPLTVVALGAAIALFALGRLWVPDPRNWPAWIDALSMVQMLPDGRLLTVADQPWRLLTSAFLHVGPVHLLFNAWWIWDLGRGIEGRRGTLVLAGLFVGSAVAASAAQWIFSGPGVGLSGVVYGLAAFLFVRRRDDPVAAAIMNPTTTRWLLTWLVLGVVLSRTGALPVGNWAHGGGALWGLAAGMATRPRWRRVGVPALVLATAGLAAWAVVAVPFWLR